jgi:hypothetical protein
MKRIHRFAPSPAMVVACLSLMVALGGVGYAATALPRNSVGTPQLKRNAVISAKVKDRSLLARDFRRGQLPRGPRGLRGLTGATGAQGPPGAPNPNAVDSDKLDGLDSTDFLRSNGVAAFGAANSADVDDFTAAAYTTVLSRSFTAPTAGFALITASIGCADDSSIAGGGSLWSRIAIDGTATTNDTFSAPACYSEFTTGGGGTATNTVVVPVTAGDHTAHLQAKSAAGSGAYIYTREITVLFVPNGIATTTPFSTGGSADGGGSSQD